MERLAFSPGGRDERLLVLDVVADNGTAGTSAGDGEKISTAG